MKNASLVLAIVALVLSVAGFALVHKQMNEVTARLDLMTAQISQLNRQVLPGGGSPSTGIMPMPGHIEPFMGVPAGTTGSSGSGSATMVTPVAPPMPMGAPSANTSVSSNASRQPIYVYNTDKEAFAAALNGPFNSDASLSDSTPSKTYSSADYLLTVPANDRWGSAQYSVPAYEVADQVVLFGPFYASELMGSFRTGSMSETAKRDAKAILADKEIKSGEFCQQDPKTSDPTVVKIGVWTAYKSVMNSCEGGLVRYEVIGQKGNYVFTGSTAGSGQQDADNLLQWVIRRFKEL